MKRIHIQIARPLRRLVAAAGLCGALAACGTTQPSVSSLLDSSDQALIASTTQAALEKNRVGESANWTNGANGHLGTVTPTRTFTTASGSVCRDYQQSATVEGRTIFAFDTACRGEDGTWRSRDHATLSQAIRYGDAPYAYPGRYGYGHPSPYYYGHRDPFCRGLSCRPYRGTSMGFGYGIGF